MQNISLQALLSISSMFFSKHLKTLRLVSNRLSWDYRESWINFKKTFAPSRPKGSLPTLTRLDLWLGICPLTQDDIRMFVVCCLFSIISMYYHPPIHAWPINVIPQTVFIMKLFFLIYFFRSYISGQWPERTYIQKVRQTDGHKYVQAHDY